MTKSTDWTSYYERPTPSASVTRKISQKRLIEIFSQDKDWISICEIGGGNSCFVDGILRSMNVSKYHVIDNNELGLRKLEKRYRDLSVVTTENGDVLNLADRSERYDIVYSVGLIEHFDPENTAKAIDAHFSLVKPGGLVVITYPTPTWLYRATRALAEVMGQWRFPDERPLKSTEVERSVYRRGEIVSHFINWPIILTQGIVTVRAT